MSNNSGMIGYHFQYLSVCFSFLFYSNAEDIAINSYYCAEATNLILYAKSSETIMISELL